MSRLLELNDKAFADGALQDAKARDRALDMSINAVVRAPAGSGKTGVLVKRFLKALALANEPEEVVAMTFTRKAAGEMRDRVLAALRGDSQEPIAKAARARDEELGWGLASNPHRIRATTIDSLCGQLAAQTPLLSKLGGAAQVADSPSELYDAAIYRLLGDLEDEAVAESDRQAVSALLKMADNRLDSLVEPLRDLLGKREQWLPILAVSDDDATDNDVLNVIVARGLNAFDAIVPACVRERLPAVHRLATDAGLDLGVVLDDDEWPGATFENLGKLRSLAALLLTKDRKGVKKRVDARMGFPAKSDHNVAFNGLLKELKEDEFLAEDLGVAAAAVCSLPDALLPEGLQQARGHINQALLRLAQHLQVVMSERGLVDHTEIASRALIALDDGSGYTELLGKIDYEVRHLLVDEMQDTSRMQLALIRLFTSGWEQGDGRSLFVVGDPMQSIYRFRQAEVRIFLQMWEQGVVGDLKLERVELTANFRSQPGVVKFANEIFKRVFPAKSDTLMGVVSHSEAEARLLPLSAWHAGNKDSEGVAFCSYTGPGAAASEADQVAESVMDIMKAGEERSVAVLARSRTHLAAVIERLKERGVPFQSNDIDVLAKRDEVRDFSALARAMWHPLDDVAWASLLRSPLVGMSFADMVLLRSKAPKDNWRVRLGKAAEFGLTTDGAERARRTLSILNAVEADERIRYLLPRKVEAAWHMLGGPAVIGSPVALRNVRSALAALVRQCPGGSVDDMRRFQEELERSYAAPEAGHVHLMTIHGSKGLEFDYVHVVGLGRRPRNDTKPLMHFLSTDDGVVFAPQPDKKLDQDGPEWRLFNYMHDFHGQANWAESARLLYVAATRAGLKLTLHCEMGYKEKYDRAYAAKGSLGDVLTPAMGIIESDYTERSWRQDLDDQGGIETATDSAVPQTLRLPVDWSYDIEGYEAYKPAERSVVKPSEAVLHGSDGKPVEELDVFSRLVGTMYHEAMEKISVDGVEAWGDHGESKRASLASGFRRMGLPEPDNDRAVTRVLSLIQGTLESEVGRRLLAPRRWARSEYKVAGHIEGKWVSGVIDRTFVDDDQETLWIIDYKTGSVDDADLDGYAAQLLEYEKLLQRLMSVKSIRSGLFFPGEGKLVELSDIKRAA